MHTTDRLLLLIWRQVWDCIRKFAVMHSCIYEVPGLTLAGNRLIMHAVLFAKSLVVMDPLAQSTQYSIPGTDTIKSPDCIECSFLHRVWISYNCSYAWIWKRDQIIFKYCFANIYQCKLWNWPWRLLECCSLSFNGLGCHRTRSIGSAWLPIYFRHNWRCYI